jgi:hypothetical protein
LAAAQRYYYDVLVNIEGLDFLTFDSLAWAVMSWVEIPPEDEDPHSAALARSCSDFANAYPGNDYVDWVSINWYTAAQAPQGLQYQIDSLERLLDQIATLAPEKPILAMEFGFADGPDPNSQANADMVTFMMEELASHPEIRAVAFWDSYQEDNGIDYSMHIGQETKMARAFQNFIEANPGYLVGCITTADGTQPACR